MLQYVFGYVAFIVGALLYMLSKVQEFKEMAAANPDPKVIYNTKTFLDKEWINIARLLIGGLALVVLLPMLLGGASVDIKNSTGSVLTTLKMQTLFIPLDFLMGYSGNSALFAFFGKYRKTLLKQVGADDN